MMRVTTRGTLYTYKSNLSGVTANLNSSIEQVLSGRNFSSFAEDPAGATRAFKIHSSANEINAQLSNIESATGKFQSAWSNMETVVDDLANEFGTVPALQGLNGTNLDNLEYQAQSLRSGAEAIVQSLNAQYESDYIFAGADTQNPPFSIVEDAEGLSHLAYRGVMLDADLDLDYVDADGNTIPKDPADPTAGNYTNLEMLDKWNQESMHIDIGLGFAVDDNGDVLPDTAYNAAISGIEFLGYGLDADGNPKDVVSTMFRLADIFESYDETRADEWGGKFDTANSLVTGFQTSQESMIEKHAELSADVKVLETSTKILEDTFESLNSERAYIEDVDLADAISELSWAQTIYNAALSMGNSVIPDTLFDYMR